MLKRTKLKIASNITVANAIQANTAAINNQSVVQQKTNQLYKEDLETKDRVDISLKEYSDLKYKERQLYALEQTLSNLLEATGLKLDELESLPKDKILVAYNEDPVNFALNIDIRLKLPLLMHRQRELLNYRYRNI